MAALKGVRVIELAGLAPAPFAGMILADFGAVVTRVDQVKTNVTLDRLARGKRSIALDLSLPQGVDVFRKLCSQADVLIEPFRPGVMEKLGLGPSVIMEDNPKLIYSRLTGYGQTGAMAKQAGHDINYIAMSGLLSMFGHQKCNPNPPLNLLGDFAGGGMLCVLGILMALLERNKSGKGQVIDTAMVDGSAYIGSFVYKLLAMGLWTRQRGQNLLDTGAHFYNTYKTLDGKYVAVGAIEPKFYKELLKGLEMSEEHLPQQMNMDEWENQKLMFEKIFLKKTRDEWCEIFKATDACFTPVLSVDEAPLHSQNKERNNFLMGEDGYEPSPAPKLSRTPAHNVPRPQPRIGQHTVEVLQEAGFSNEDITQWLKIGIIKSLDAKTSL